MNLSNLDNERKQAILNAALNEFALKGYDQASTNVIAKEAGISKALMFHYVSNKQDLFLFVYDYFNDILQKQYFEKMDFTEKDLLQRLRQSYQLQMTLIKQYPTIFEWEKLNGTTKSDAVNQGLKKRSHNIQGSCEWQLFQEIDLSKFKPELDDEKAKNIICWSMKGFFEQLLEQIKGSKNIMLDEPYYTEELDNYLVELRRAFYR